MGSLMDTLRLTEPMMKGPAVRRLQEMGDQLGVDGGPNDGIFGPDTLDVVLRLQNMLDVEPDGICGPVTWQAILGEVDKQAPAVKPSVPVLGRLDRVVDIRGEHPAPRLYKCPRKWTDIKGITLHQTGCNMPTNPAGWSRLNAHLGITQEGLVVFVNGPLDWIWHGQGLSKGTIGIEIEGNYPGIMGNEKTLWLGGGPAASLNPEMMTALDQCFELLVWLFNTNGQKWRYIFGHRQSARSRIADPGEEIWKAVALDWNDRLNALDGFNEQRDGGPQFCKGEGRPIPKQWDDTRVVNYWAQ